VVLPLYQLICCSSFGRIRGDPAGPGLKGQEVDLALFKLSVKTFDPWLVGRESARPGVLTRWCLVR